MLAFMLWMKKDQFSKSFDVTFNPAANIYTYIFYYEKNIDLK